MDDPITKGSVIWQGEQYRAYVMRIEPEYVKMGVSERLSVDDRTKWRCTYESANGRYVGHRRYKRRSFLPDRTSIHEAVMRAVQDAQGLDRKWQETQRHLNGVRDVVEAASEVHNIASSL